MSMDYPYYEELCRRKHPARRWWRVGDILYYVGVLSALLGPPIAALVGAWDHAGIVFGVSLFIFVCGVLAKRYSYVLGKRSGINVDDD
jgi:hypothetical protein